MKYVSHFIRYSLAFFAVFEVIFALILFVSADFDVYKIIRRHIAMNIITIVCTCIVSLGCGYYISSFLIFHHKMRCPIFVAALAMSMLALKCDSGNIFLHRLCSFFAMPPIVMMCILFVLSFVLLSVSLVAQTRHNLIIIHSSDPAGIYHENALFM